jgi:hypothetical protein
VTDLPPCPAPPCPLPTWAPKVRDALDALYAADRTWTATLDALAAAAPPPWPLDTPVPAPWPLPPLPLDAPAAPSALVDALAAPWSDPADPSAVVDLDA